MYSTYMTKPTATPIFAGDVIEFNLNIAREELKAAEAIEAHCEELLISYDANILTGISESITGPGSRILRSAAVKMKNATLTINSLRPKIDELEYQLASAMTIF